MGEGLVPEAPNLTNVEEALVVRAVISSVERRAVLEPLYDVDPRTGTSIEVFYADRVLAESFGTNSGWFWWVSQRGHPAGRADWSIRD
jgi:hypothetical protein